MNKLLIAFSVLFALSVNAMEGNFVKASRWNHDLVVRVELAQLPAKYAELIHDVIKHYFFQVTTFMFEKVKMVIMLFLVAPIFLLARL